MSYNQLAQKQTNYACSVYAYLNAIKHDFGIKLKIDWILKIVIYMEKIGALLPKWAYASVIYPALNRYTKWKTWFSLKIEKWTLNTIDPDKWYILGFKKGSRTYLGLSKDWIDKDDIDTIRNTTSFYWHFHFWKRNTIDESLGDFTYNMPLEVLKYASDIYYPTTRRIVADSPESKRVQKLVLQRVKNRKKYLSLDEFLTYYKNSHGWI